MNKYAYVIVGFVALALVVAGSFALRQKPLDYSNEEQTNKTSEKTQDKRKAVVYKSLSCGCCVGYAEVLRDRGFEVETVNIEDMDSIKDKYGVSKEARSCHTVVIGDYFIEGHVPMEAVDKLLSEKPDIDGISLPGMPSGSPGMPGEKRAPYTVYQIIDGVASEFLTI